MHCVDTGHDTWGDQGDKEEEEIEADEVHNLEGYQVKFLMSFEGTRNLLMKVFRIDRLRARHFLSSHKHGYSTRVLAQGLSHIH